MTNKPKTLLQKIAQRARTNRAIEETEAERKRKKREKERKLRAKANESTPSGLSAKFAAKLQASAKKAAEDPKARAMVERGRLLKRIQQDRLAEGKDPTKPEPNAFMGTPIEEWDETRTVKDVERVMPTFPKSMSELRDKARTKQRNRRGRVKKTAEITKAAKAEEEKADQ